MQTVRGGKAMDKAKMGKFLTQLRNDKGLRQQDEAEIFQVTPQAISKWESGDSVPDIGTLEKLSNFYKVGIDEIINGEIKNPNANVSTLVVARNPSLEDRGIGRPYYGSFIFSMSAIVVAFILGFLPYVRVTQYGLSGDYVSYINLYSTLFSVFTIATTFAWLSLLTFLTSALLSLGLWLSPAGRRSFWIASFWLNLIHLALNVCLLSILVVETTSNLSSRVLVEPGSVFLTVFAGLYFVLFLTLPITRKKTYCPKKKQNVAVVNK